MRSLLERHVDSVIGVNYAKPKVLGKARLVSVDDTHFSIGVRLGKDLALIHYPWSSVLSITESAKGAKGALSVRGEPVTVSVIVSQNFELGTLWGVSVVF